MAKPRLNLQGRTFNYLTVISDAGNTPSGKSQWLVECVCGTRKVLAAQSFYRATDHPVIKSCGCMKAQLIAEKTRTHGMSKHPAFAVWLSMLARCQRKSHPAWKNYGGRGITTCSDWQTFEGFWTDMGSSYQPGLSLDRIDNSKGYFKANCRWTTMTRQACNRRGNRRIHTPWGYLTVSEASRKSGIGYSTLLYRLDQKVSRDRIFETPDMGRKFNT